VVLDEAAATTAVADKEVTDKRATEEAAAKRDVEERAVEEAAVKAAAVEEVAGKTMNEAVRAAGGSPAPGQVPSVAGGKRVAAPSSSTPPAKHLYMGVWKPWFVPLSLFFQVGLHSLITLFAVGTAAANATVRVTPRSALDGEPRNPKGIREDVVEDFKGEP
jgi:hypothetical protein